MMTNLSIKTRALLDRYTLSSHTLNQAAGERLTRKVGQSVEFYDFRPYQAGDELRYVDWKVYGRTGKLYTRLYQAEWNIRVHILLDTSPSMSIEGKANYAKTLAKILSYVAKQTSGTHIHLFNGESKSIKKTVEVPHIWSFIENAPTFTQLPTEAIKSFALDNRNDRGLVLIISDFFDEAPLQQSLIALKRRGFDASFLQVISQADLEPEVGQFELIDVESREKIFVNPQEIIAYHQAAKTFLKQTRQSILQAGFRHVLFKVTETRTSLEQLALAALIQGRVLIRS